MSNLNLPEDGRQSATALDIQRGTMRMLRAHAFAPICEHALANNRRADIIALSDKGEVWIIEIKSSLEDFRADNKWPEYRDYCDRFFFAVKPEFPSHILPENTGLILADRFQAEIVQDAPEHRLGAPRRKALTLAVARAAALRLAKAVDPDLPTRVDAWRPGK
ncbi:MAG: MmcB family DNA repair protein [Hyphomicrobiaceae bacterium]